MVLSAFLGVLIGTILGLTGAGGGILAVPALTTAMHWTLQQAAPVALIAVALGAAVGAAEGWRKGLVRYKAAALIAVSGFPMVYGGQALAHQIAQPLLQAGFAAVMLWVAFRLYRQAGKQDAGESLMLGTMTQLDPASGKFVWTLPTAGVLVSIGGLTGFLTGLLGVGGGFVIVPLLRKLTPVAMPGVVATSLMVVALVSASGVVSALLHQVAIPWTAALTFSFTTVIGMVLGRRLATRLAPHTVQAAFAGVLAVVAGSLLWAAFTGH